MHKNNVLVFHDVLFRWTFASKYAINKWIFILDFLNNKCFFCSFKIDDDANIDGETLLAMFPDEIKQPAQIAMDKCLPNIGIVILLLNKFLNF